MNNIIKNNAIYSGRPVILLAPLDWGLGHATRCVPLIKYILSLDYEVIIAGEGQQLALLKQEFPALRCVYLRGYRLNYANSGWKTVFSLFLQIPKILTAIKRENRWLNNFLKESTVNAVISDNRYGLYHPSIPAVIITHQLSIRTFWNGAGERFLRKINYHFINKFAACWVPDYKEGPGLAGMLSHPSVLPSVPVSYLGPLSRLYPVHTGKTGGLLILLSGPEPQRTLLEKICLRELIHYHEPVTLIRGLPGNKNTLDEFNKVIIYNHLSSGEINAAINAATVILSRSGYSTVMDLMILQKRCIFIPTPGQTEQLYLAEHLSSRKHCIFYRQQEFSLETALRAIKTAQLVPFSAAREDSYKKVIKDLLH